ncbi:MAG: hypothetical protein N2Z67_06580 [Acetobacteraceae bacterium]|nr:hypothetical protein [Acetobacteraceae bacterium]
MARGFAAGWGGDHPIYAGGPALGPGGVAPRGTAAIDHVSLACRGFHAYRRRFAAAGLDWREFLVPGTTLWRLFVHDPSGVQFELTFDGASFFDPATCPDAARLLLPEEIAA